MDYFQGRYISRFPSFSSEGNSLETVLVKGIEESGKQISMKDDTTNPRLSSYLHTIKTLIPVTFNWVKHVPQGKTRSVMQSPFTGSCEVAAPVAGASASRWRLLEPHPRPAVVSGRF